MKTDKKEEEKKDIENQNEEANAEVKEEQNKEEKPKKYINPELLNDDLEESAKIEQIALQAKPYFSSNILPKSEPKTFREFIPLLCDNDKEKNNNLYYEYQLSELKVQLQEEKNKNEILINENNYLKICLNEEKIKTKKIEEKIKLLNEELKNYKGRDDNGCITSINQGEKIMAINFVSMSNDDIKNYNIICKNTELFIRIEEKLYQDFPNLKEYDNYFVVNTKRIKRFKTIEENKIKNNDIISIYTIDN